MAQLPNLPGYATISKLGGGGFGNVYLAKENVSGRLVAIKSLKNDDPDVQQELIDEIQLIAKLDQPNVVNYYHPIIHDNKIHFVMEYCERGDLYKGKGTQQEIIRWITDCSYALSKLHDEGVFHNDLKPGNILISNNGIAKISDFGCANLYRGTIAFMPPEFLAGEFTTLQDPRRDVYALGLTLLELLCGTNPFYDLEREQIIEKHLAGDIWMADTPEWLQEVILKSMHRIPELRFQSTLEFAEALEAKSIPSILNKRKLLAGALAKKIDNLSRQKKWAKARSVVDAGLIEYADDVSVLRASGAFFLKRNDLANAYSTLSKAVKINPRVDIQKELGLCQLELGNHTKAISLINDHLSRSGLDLEAYNALIRCYYETGRYEYAIDLANELLSTKSMKLDCLVNNKMICEIMREKCSFDHLLRSPNPFIQYHLKLISEDKETFSRNGKPSLKSKLLFQEYRFDRLRDGANSFWISKSAESTTGHLSEISKAIYRIGRLDYENDLEFPTNKVSRRHAVIINQRNDVWLYDLGSTGTQLNRKQISKSPIMDRSSITINKDFSFSYISDPTKLL
ncbi:pentatricopeptide repeat domain-containing protein (PPR motif) [Ekhidna lutea]|uniref:mitogen-activated protein kinase kinase n=1 Tax=Ekhidna lutea TaxID=447679 RepID=A0A239LDG7_EKHLU|nr:FHA domain-containing serine/threonine-protein kinase [Ekhidna lutea]SNT28686.1 pentatricopeptide repeat domain-containing protein (PPR motif) [Ekhidna lutea]